MTTSITLNSACICCASGFGLNLSCPVHSGVVPDQLKVLVPQARALGSDLYVSSVRKCWHLNVVDGECQNCGAWG